MIGVVVTLLAIGLLAYFVLKNYYPPIILLIIGLVLFTRRRHARQCSGRSKSLNRLLRVLTLPKLLPI